MPKNARSWRLAMTEEQKEAEGHQKSGIFHVLA
jgi:hypothetical protein